MFTFSCKARGYDISAPTSSRCFLEQKEGRLRKHHQRPLLPAKAAGGTGRACCGGKRSSQAFPPALPADTLRVTSESDENSSRGKGRPSSLVFEQHPTNDPLRQELRRRVACGSERCIGPFRLSIKTIAREKTDANEKRLVDGVPRICSPSRGRREGTMYQRLLLPGASSSRTSVDCENTIDVHSSLQKRQAAQEEPAAAAKAVHKPFPPALPADALRVSSRVRRRQPTG